MKRFIPIIIISSIIIVSALRACWSRDDAVSGASTTEAQQKPIDKALMSRTDSFISAQKAVGTVGLMVYDLTAERSVYAYRADVPMRPASCMKLLSCIAALRKAGTRYEYRTRLYTAGRMEKDTLYGNLILKTQFDPFFNRDSLHVLLGTLKQKNIKAIKGKIVLDMAFIEPMNHEQHWTMGDLKVNRMGLIYHGYRKMRTETLYALQAIGAKVHKDSIVFGRLVPRKATQIGEIRTPIHFVVEKALKNSSNINAESLMYLLGYTVHTGGNFRKNGIVALRRFVSDELGMDPSKVCNIEDGCGLCPDDRLTPELLIALLNYAYKHPAIYNDVLASLPLSGTDGTLYDRLRKPNVLGKVRAKTGTLTREGGISTLAGYYTGNDGHLMAFCVMNNECPVMDGRWWQDRFCDKVLLPAMSRSAGHKKN